MFFWVAVWPQLWSAAQRKWNTHTHSDWRLDHILENCCQFRARQTRIPPKLTCLFDDDYRFCFCFFYLPFSAASPGRWHPRSMAMDVESCHFYSKRNPLLSRHFFTPVSLVIKIFAATNTGLINQEDNTLRAKGGTATTTTGVKRKPFVFLWGCFFFLSVCHGGARICESVCHFIGPYLWSNTSDCRKQPCTSALESNLNQRVEGTASPQVTPQHVDFVDWKLQKQWRHLTEGNCKLIDVKTHIHANTHNHWLVQFEHVRPASERTGCCQCVRGQEKKKRKRKHSKENNCTSEFEWPSAKRLQHLGWDQNALPLLEGKDLPLRRPRSAQGMCDGTQRCSAVLS